MKIIFYLCLILNLINALNLNLVFNNKSLNETIHQRSEFYEKMNFHSYFLIENEKFKEYTKHYIVSCVKLNLQSNRSREVFSFESFCNLSKCTDFSTKISLAPQRICPLYGKIKRAKLFLRIEQKSVYFRQMVAIIDGCYYKNENETNFKTTWIFAEDWLSENILPSIQYEKYDRILTDDIYFHDDNKNCSKLCETQCPANLHTTMKSITEEWSGVSIEIYIYGVSIFGVIIGCSLIYYCFRERLLCKKQ